MSCVVQDLTVDKVIKTRIWKVARIEKVMLTKKFEKVISCFQTEDFHLVVFLCFFCVMCFYLCLLYFFHYFSFALLTIIGTTKQQKTH